MMNILALLQCIQPAISSTNVKRLSQVVIAMIAMTVRVTMLGISKWTGKGGSYRTIQRFFNAIIPWTLVFKLFFEEHLNNADGEYFLVAVESGRVSLLTQAKCIFGKITNPHSNYPD